MERFATDCSRRISGDRVAVLAGNERVISISISTSNLTAEKRENWYVVGGSESGPKCRYDAVRKWAARRISCLVGRSPLHRTFPRPANLILVPIERPFIHANYIFYSLISFVQIISSITVSQTYIYIYIIFVGIIIN